MKIHNDLVQGTPEWLQVRIGKFTASDAQAISANGKGLETLVYKKAAEIMTGKPEESYTNQDMERGNTLEDMARDYYQIRNGVVVEQVGFVEMSDQVGCSPDGLVGEEGLIEIKCKNDTNFVKFMFDGKIDTKYEWQMQMQLLVTGRQWVDYALFNPNFREALIVARVIRDEKKIEKIEKGIESAVTMLSDVLEAIK